MVPCVDAKSAGAPRLLLLLLPRHAIMPAAASSLAASRRRKTPLLLLLLAVTASLARGKVQVEYEGEGPPATHHHDEGRHSWNSLSLAIVKHLKQVTQEIDFLFKHFCQPAMPHHDTPLERNFEPRFEQDNVRVPSCAALRDAGLERYYGNINLLMAEAWRSKVIDQMRSLVHHHSKPLVDLLLVREPADEMVAGGIFVSQLMRDDKPASAALMIGIHRMPKHKMLRVTSRGYGMQPQVNVTDAIVTKAKEWLSANGLGPLVVCTLEGDDGQLRRRLVAHGFRNATEADGLKDYKFGRKDLLEDVCEEAVPMAFDPPPKHDEL